MDAEKGMFADTFPQLKRSSLRCAAVKSDGAPKSASKQFYMEDSIE